ncbi:MAG TPA: glutamate-1-semialdehyde 2,1-aminomutase [Phycisphaerae bacterium]|nr:glutamate-1-semialdehyde 2,1-aminomutase [Phycisphaerae bacterium]HRR84706.1 glutamate-1-semialdehyde 2,1-aminomutase [Phycisphaerae bacterium]
MAKQKSETDETQKNKKSQAAFTAALRVLAGGVNSPVRAFGAIGGVPRFIAKAKGATLTDLDGNDYIDYVCSWGPLILGHTDERVAAAASKALDKGWSYGAPTEAETRLAERIVEDFPSIERIRFVNSGTEAVMSAVRLARGFTGRDLVVKCEGCYHGHVDYLLVKAGSGLATFGTPSSAGVPTAMTANTLVVPYNDLGAAREVFERHGSRIAAFLVEPVAGNMGCVPPVDGYLAGLRQLCDEAGALLIFDEIVTGYRVSVGGAQEAFGVRPDLTCLGKIIGGGMPVGAYGGRADVMEKLSPVGPVYQAGTLSGNPLAMAAGLATLEALHEPGTYERLDTLATRLEDGLKAAAATAGVPAFVTRVASMCTLFFQVGPVTDYASAARSDTRAYAQFVHAMLERGVYLPPSQFETFFVSAAHTEEQIDQTLAAAAEAFQVLKPE